MNNFSNQMCKQTSSLQSLAAPLEEPVRDEPLNSQTTVSRKDLKRLSTDAPGSLETEQSNLAKLKMAFESFGETTKAYHDELRNIKIRLKEGKEMYEQTEEILKKFNAAEIQSRFNAVTKKNPGDVLSRINPGNLDEQLKDMEKRILLAKGYLANSQHTGLKKSIDKYHEIFKRSLENFDMKTCEPCTQLERMDKANTVYSTKRLLEEANRVIPEEEERDQQAANTIAMMKKMATSLSETSLKELSTFKPNPTATPPKSILKKPPPEES
ncbi:uncharacterized protein LOC106671973 [Cimex lectularius]|uniref:Uncharacterized protein n=1 Tax=Cimex lectularius TaxID=79782 RepID=A0A8I6S7V8_CIMLE|nr:uncharacterized protein LOC106671973 [Cimex lectularius]